MPIYIATSQWFIVIATVFYGMTALGLWLSLVPWWLILLINLCLGLDYIRVINLFGLRQHKFAVTIVMQDCDKWQYQLKSGRSYKATLDIKQSYCSSLVIILCMQHMHGRRYIVIPRDSLSIHNYRLLAYNLNCH